MRALCLALGLGALLCTGCLAPSGRRPGVTLHGEEVAALPADWSFTDQYREIELEAHALLLDHAVTIWCSAVEGGLYVGARSPESKRWTKLVARDPDVRLSIADRIYEVTLSPVDDPYLAERVRDAYARKYQLPAPKDPASAPSMRYWRVLPRAR